MNYRILTKDEQTCVNNCTHRFTQTNRRFMQQFMEHTPEMMRRKQEAAQQQMEKMQRLEAAQTAAESVQAPAVTLDKQTASEIPISEQLTPPLQNDVTPPDLQNDSNIDHS